jgi:hypothetical protein
MGRRVRSGDKKLPLSRDFSNIHTGLHSCGKVVEGGTGCGFWAVDFLAAKKVVRRLGQRASSILSLTRRPGGLFF